MTNPMELCCSEDTLNQQLDPTTQEYLISSRRIFIDGDISPSVANYVNSYLQYYAIADPKKPVYIYISSNGGDIISGYAIIDQMELSPFPIFTIVRGCAYSMAAIIAAFGSKKCRFITKNSSIMIHEAMFMPSIDTLPLQKKRTDFLMQEDRIKMESLSLRLKIKYKKLLEITKENHWMNSEEAIKIGFVDGIWTNTMEQYVNDTRDCQEEKTDN